MTQAKPQQNPSSDATIIASFFWPFSRADLACMLHVNHEHIRRVWERAKERGDLPNVARPGRGFDQRRNAMGMAA